MLISVANLNKYYGARRLLNDVSFRVDAGARIGLIGANGCGKTTLLRILVGLEHAESGAVNVPRSVRIGYLEQEPELDPDATVYQAALSAFDDLRALETRMRELERDISEADEARRPGLTRGHGELLERFERSGGYDHESRVRAALEGVGFAPAARGRRVRRLSGGERSRLALVRLLLKAPGLLLLDEPTTHLDLNGVEWLERFLAKYPGGALLVSHDRAFLDRVANRIFEIERARLETYSGGYSRYAEIKAARLLEQRRLYERRQEFIAREEAFIRRYGAGQRHKEARGRQKRLDRLERPDKPHEERAANMRFEAGASPGALCLRVRGLALRFRSRTLFEDLDFDLHPGDRAGIVGPNGCGKTSLLNILLGRLDPSGGLVERGHNLRVGYYDQLQEGLRPSRTALDEVWDLQRTRDEKDVRDLLALFRFSGDDVLKTVSDLSGGERGRLALAKLMAQAPNLLALDEPTEPLDIPSREALENALSEYRGAVIVVSHDRYFLNRVVDKILVFEPPRIRVINGDYALYESIRAREGGGSEASSPAAQRPRAAQGAERPAISKNRFSRIESRIIELEGEMERIDALLRTPEVYSDGVRARRLTARRETAALELDQLNEQWDQAAEQM